MKEKNLILRASEVSGLILNADYEQQGIIGERISIHVRKSR